MRCGPLKIVQFIAFDCIHSRWWL